MVLDSVSKNEKSPPGIGLSDRLELDRQPGSRSLMGTSGTVSTAETVKQKSSKNALGPGPENTAIGHRISLGMMPNHGTLKNAGTGSKKKVIKVRASALSGKNPSDVDIKHLEQVIKNYESGQQASDADIKHLEQVVKNYESGQKAEDNDSSIAAGHDAPRSGRPSRPERRVSAGQENRKRSVSRRRRSVSRGRVNSVTEEVEDAAEEEVTFAVKDPSNSPARRRRSRSRGRHEGANSPTIQEIMRPHDESAPHRPRSQSRGRDHAAIDDVQERREEKQRSRSRGRPETSEAEKQERKARSRSCPRPVGKEKLEVDHHADEEIDSGITGEKPKASNVFGWLAPTMQLKKILQAKQSGNSLQGPPSDAADATEEVLSTGIISREQLEQLLVAGFRISAT
jgi:hypothetical protein